jgi:hypothetical protein
VHSGHFWLEQAEMRFYSRNISARVILKIVSYRFSGALYPMAKSKSIFENFIFLGFLKNLVFGPELQFLLPVTLVSLQVSSSSKKESFLYLFKSETTL